MQINVYEFNDCDNCVRKINIDIDIWLWVIDVYLMCRFHFKCIRSTFDWFRTTSFHSSFLLEKGKLDFQVAIHCIKQMFSQFFEHVFEFQLMKFIWIFTEILWRIFSLDGCKEMKRVSRTSIVDICLNQFLQFTRIIVFISLPVKIVVVILLKS